MDLYDLIIYALEDGETIDKFSAEHITKFYMDGEFLVVDSTERYEPERYVRDRLGFLFQGR